MNDRIRKLMVPSVFGAVIAGVWTLGALKAHVDSPMPAYQRVDPSCVNRAMLAVEPANSPPAIADGSDATGLYYWFAS